MPPDRGPEVVAALEQLFSIEDREEQIHHIATRDQTRMLWGPTYVDLFFMDTAFHESLATRARGVDFGGTEISIISAEDLVVCKALFNRPHDWIDIGRIAAIQGEKLDRPYTQQWVEYFVGPDDPIVEHLRDVQGDDPM